MVTVSLVVELDTRYTRVERTRCANHTSLHTRVQLLLLQSDTTMCSHHWARARGVTRSWEQVTERVSSTDIDRAVNGDARRASLSMLLVSISLGRHWRHLTARSELEDPLTAERVELFHFRLLLRTHEDRLRAQLKTEVEKSDACGVQRVLQLSRRSAHQRERNFVPVGPPIYNTVGG